MALLHNTVFYPGGSWIISEPFFGATSIANSNCVVWKEDNRIYVHHRTPSNGPKCIASLGTSLLHALGVTHQGDQIAVGTESEIKVFDAISGSTVGSVVLPEGSGAPVVIQFCLRNESPQKLLFCVTNRGRVLLWNCAYEWKCVFELDVPVKNSRVSAGYVRNTTPCCEWSRGDINHSNGLEVYNHGTLRITIGTDNGRIHRYAIVPDGIISFRSRAMHPALPVHRLLNPRTHSLEKITSSAFPHPLFSSETFTLPPSIPPFAPNSPSISASISSADSSAAANVLGQPNVPMRTLGRISFPSSRILSAVEALIPLEPALVREAFAFDVTMDAKLKQLQARYSASPNGAGGALSGSLGSLSSTGGFSSTGRSAGLHLSQTFSPTFPAPRSPRPSSAGSAFPLYSFGVLGSGAWAEYPTYCPFLVLCTAKALLIVPIEALNAPNNSFARPNSASSMYPSSQDTKETRIPQSQIVDSMTTLFCTNASVAQSVEMSLQANVDAIAVAFRNAIVNEALSATMEVPLENLAHQAISTFYGEPGEVHALDLAYMSTIPVPASSVPDTETALSSHAQRKDLSVSFSLSSPPRAGRRSSTNPSRDDEPEEAEQPGLGFFGDSVRLSSIASARPASPQHTARPRPGSGLPPKSPRGGSNSTPSRKGSAPPSHHPYLQPDPAKPEKDKRSFVAYQASISEGSRSSGMPAFASSSSGSVAATQGHSSTPTGMSSTVQNLSNDSNGRIRRRSAIHTLPPASDSYLLTMYDVSTGLHCVCDITGLLHIARDVWLRQRSSVCRDFTLLLDGRNSESPNDSAFYRIRQLNINEPRIHTIFRSPERDDDFPFAPVQSSTRPASAPSSSSSSRSSSRASSRRSSVTPKPSVDYVPATRISRERSATTSSMSSDAPTDTRTDRPPLTTSPQRSIQSLDSIASTHGIAAAAAASSAADTLLPRSAVSNLVPSHTNSPLPGPSATASGASSPTSTAALHSNPSAPLSPVPYSTNLIQHALPPKSRAHNHPLLATSQPFLRDKVLSLSPTSLRPVSALGIPTSSGDNSPVDKQVDRRGSFPVDIHTDWRRDSEFRVPVSFDAPLREVHAVEVHAVEAPLPPRSETLSSTSDDSNTKATQAPNASDEDESDYIPPALSRGTRRLQRPQSAPVVSLYPPTNTSLYYTNLLDFNMSRTIAKELLDNQSPHLPTGLDTHSRTTASVVANSSQGSSYPLSQLMAPTSPAPSGSLITSFARYARYNAAPQNTTQPIYPGSGDAFSTPVPKAKTSSKTASRNTSKSSSKVNPQTPPRPKQLAETSRPASSSSYLSDSIDLHATRATQATLLDRASSPPPPVPTENAESLTNRIFNFAQELRSPLQSNSESQRKKSRSKTKSSDAKPKQLSLASLAENRSRFYERVVAPLTPKGSTIKTAAATDSSSHTSRPSSSRSKSSAPASSSRPSSADVTKLSTGIYGDKTLPVTADGVPLVAYPLNTTWHPVVREAYEKHADGPGKRDETMRREEAKDLSKKKIGKRKSSSAEEIKKQSMDGTSEDRIVLSTRKAIEAAAKATDSEYVSTRPRRIVYSPPPPPEKQPPSTQPQSAYAPFRPTLLTLQTTTPAPPSPPSSKPPSNTITLTPSFSTATPSATAPLRPGSAGRASSRRTSLASSTLPFSLTSSTIDAPLNVSYRVEARPGLTATNAQFPGTIQRLEAVVSPEPGISSNRTCSLAPATHIVSIPVPVTATFPVPTPVPTPLPARALASATAIGSNTVASGTPSRPQRYLSSSMHTPSRTPSHGNPYTSQPISTSPPPPPTAKMTPQPVRPDSAASSSTRTRKGSSKPRILTAAEQAQQYAETRRIAKARQQQQQQKQTPATTPMRTSSLKSRGYSESLDDTGEWSRLGESDEVPEHLLWSPESRSRRGADSYSDANFEQKRAEARHLFLSTPLIQRLQSIKRHEKHVQIDPNATTVPSMSMASPMPASHMPVRATIGVAPMSPNLRTPQGKYSSTVTISQESVQPVTPVVYSYTPQSTSSPSSSSHPPPPQPPSQSRPSSPPLHNMPPRDVTSPSHDAQQHGHHHDHDHDHDQDHYQDIGFLSHHDNEEAVSSPSLSPTTPNHPLLHHAAAMSSGVQGGLLSISAHWAAEFGRDFINRGSSSSFKDNDKKAEVKSKSRAEYVPHEPKGDSEASQTAPHQQRSRSRRGSTSRFPTAQAQTQPQAASIPMPKRDRRASIAPSLSSTPSVASRRNSNDIALLNTDDDQTESHTYSTAVAVAAESSHLRPQSASRRSTYTDKRGLAAAAIGVADSDESIPPVAAAHASIFEDLPLGEDMTPDEAQALLTNRLLFRHSSSRSLSDVDRASVLPHPDSVAPTPSLDSKLSEDENSWNTSNTEAAASGRHDVSGLDMNTHAVPSRTMATHGDVTDQSARIKKPLPTGAAAARLNNPRSSNSITSQVMAAREASQQSFAKYMPAPQRLQTILFPNEPTREELAKQRKIETENNFVREAALKAFKKRLLKQNSKE